MRFTERAARGLRHIAALIEAHMAIRDFRSAPHEPQAAYEFVRDYQFGHLHIYSMQVESEALALLALVAEKKPRNILELGTGKGGTTYLLTRVAPDDATIVTVDVEGGPFGGGYPRSHSRFLRSFARASQSLTLIKADSHSPATAKRIKDIVPTLDMLFIDGDHRYEGVKQDFADYSSLVNSGGFIVFHDIVEGRMGDVGGVPQFWDEIKGTHPNREIVEDPEQGGYGIGVLFV